MDLKASESSSLRCPYCHEEILENSITLRCPECHTIQHKACVLFTNQCAVHGCGATRLMASALRAENKKGRRNSPIYPCPNCGSYRTGADSACQRCEWAPRGEKSPTEELLFGHDCPFCGVCNYETREITKDCADDPVLKVLAETSEMRFFLRICDACGHVSIFRKTLQ